MITLTEEEAGAALGLPPLAAPVTGVSIDTRTIRPGDLFIALRGERFDGHDFVKAALQAGAAGAVVREGRREGVMAALKAGPRLAGEVSLYVVPDTLKALWALARAVRRKSGALVFAVTGSVGKTTTKDLLGAMVSQCRRVVVTPANQNNEVGVPLTLLAIDPDTEAVVLELGMRGRGQIAELASVAEPDIGIITNIHPVHLELLGSLDNIAEAKAELLCGLQQGGVGVVPAGCEILGGPALRAGCRLIRFGSSEVDQRASSDVRVTLVTEGGGDRSRLCVHWPQGQVVLEVHDFPGYLTENLAAATAACYAAGLPVADCLEGVGRARLSRGRGEVLDLGALAVIDDTYNANPAAVQRALERLVDVARRKGGRPVAVLGDMLELGPEELAFHQQVGRYAAHLGVAELWGVGQRSRATVEAFQREALEAPAGHLDSLLEISRVIRALRAGDVVLVKASRSIGLEKVVATIVEEAQRGRWEDIACSEPRQPEEIGRP